MFIEGSPKDSSHRSEERKEADMIGQLDFAPPNGARSCIGGPINISLLTE